eukprot:TRINITY_DN1919_c0_g2_i2.p1 TRINITY_DN1919_c0_g2~~TRINITY_DN1919_c0_g2_i2.p1  ORF type:complete len:227 (+),score=20.86 TRINITY_DN1919_c0_g2_i2:625-1305(+)
METVFCIVYTDKPANHRDQYRMLNPKRIPNSESNHNGVVDDILAVGTKSSGIILYNIESGAFVTAIGKRKMKENSLSMSRCGKMVAVCELKRIPIYYTTGLKVGETVDVILLTEPMSALSASFDLEGRFLVLTPQGVSVYEQQSDSKKFSLVHHYQGQWKETPRNIVVVGPNAVAILFDYEIQVYGQGKLVRRIPEMEKYNALAYNQEKNCLVTVIEGNQIAMIKL